VTVENAAAPEACGPLKDLTVVDVGMLFAGPLTATFLADLGANVIKVEHPQGDEVRRVGRFRDGKSLWWRVAARNKRLISVDIRTPDGADIIRRLARKADVLIENFRPGRFAEWGFSYDALSQDNPGLVMLHISGYGQTGPYSQRPGMGTLAEAFSGFAHCTGETDGPPTLPQFPLADGVAALTGAYSVLAALWTRSRNGGRGDEIDISLYEPLLPLLGAMTIDYDQLGFVSKRRGNRSTWSVPRNAYRTKDDRWVAVSAAANSIAKRLFRAIGRADLADDPTLATNPLRVKRLEECDSAIAKWIGEHTQEEVLDHFLKHEVVAGPIFDVAQIFDDQHVKERGTLVEMDDPELGKVRLQSVVPRYRRNPGKQRWPGKPDIGADSEGVLLELGYSQGDVERMRETGAVKFGPASAIKSEAAQ
jgi:crotonobetainyl-CoA:carnitine CoA-transferase CaiB-like acyl-CoA transferase